MADVHDQGTRSGKLDLTCICIELRNAANALTKLYDAQLVPAGISITQLSQLNHIYQQGKPTLKELAASTGLDRSTLGRNMRLLEQQGLVTISAGKDARTKVVSLTRQGQATLAEAAPLWIDMQSRLTEKLGPEKRALLSELLTELTA
jgi:DNA-binding MarR family transcriptional regulator